MYKLRRYSPNEFKEIYRGKKKNYYSSNITVNLNGKQINTSNEDISCTLNEYFLTNEIN